MRWQERNAFSKTLVLFNRHALLFVPLFCGTFCVMAGWIGTDYGVQYLFRDSRPPESIDLSERLLYFVRSTRLFSQLYATALMGLVWTLFVLIEEWDEDPDVLHPVTGVWSILFPPVVLLSLPMIVAALVNRDEHDAPYVLVLLLSLLGFFAGLLIVAGVTGLGLVVSRRLKVHQLWTFSGLSLAIVTGVSFLPVVTPSKAIFLALAACVLVYCAFEVAKARYRLLLVAGIVALLLVGSFVPKFKYRWPDMDHYYEEWSPNQAKTSREEPPVALLDAKATLEAWLEQQRRASPERPKLVIVATSGGAYRATFWTAIVLDKLTSDERLPGLARSVRLMTGASGGMIGAAYFVTPPIPGGPSLKARLQEELRERGDKVWLTNSNADSLTPVVQKMIGLDLLNAFLPYRNLRDRGQVLQDEWESLQVPFASLQAGERDGSRPSLIVTPYLVDSGKPLFISNLNLREMIAGLKRRRLKDDGDLAGPDGDDAPDFAVEFFREFPQAQKEFKLATAVRMSSTFPFISPAVRLPLQNRSRVVDAGYFDNFGITAAAAFLRHPAVQKFIVDKTSGVVLIRVLAFPEPTKADEAKLAYSGGSWFRFQQGIEQLTSPLEGALAARETRGQFANQLLLRELKELYGTKLEEFIFANTRFGSYSWHLQDHEIEAMEAIFAGDLSNKKELDRLVRVWRERGPGQAK